MQNGLPEDSDVIEDAVLELPVLFLFNGGNLSGPDGVSPVVRRRCFEEEEFDVEVPFTAAPEAPDLDAVESPSGFETEAATAPVKGITGGDAAGIAFMSTFNPSSLITSSPIL